MSKGQRLLAAPRTRAARWTIEQNAAGRPDAELCKGLGAGQWPLDGLAQALLRIVLTPDVLPADVGHVDVDRADGSGLQGGETVSEVFLHASTEVAQSYLHAPQASSQVSRGY